MSLKIIKKNIEDPFMSHLSLIHLTSVCHLNPGSAVVNLLASSAATAPPHSTHYSIHNTNVNGHHRGHTNTIGTGVNPHSYSEDASGSEEHEDNYEDSATGYGGEEDDSQGADLPSSRTHIPSLYST